jgi:hypothetical protein
MPALTGFKSMQAAMGRAAMPRHFLLVQSLEIDSPWHGG